MISTIRRNTVDLGFECDDTIEILQGDIVIIRPDDNNEPHIVARVAGNERNDYALISLVDGNRWTEPAPLKMLAMLVRHVVKRGTILTMKVGVPG